MHRFNTLRNLALTAIFTALFSSPLLAASQATDTLADQLLNETVKNQIEQTRIDIAQDTQADLLNDAATNLIMAATVELQEVPLSDLEPALIVGLDKDDQASMMNEE